MSSASAPGPWCRSGRPAWTRQAACRARAARAAAAPGRHAAARARAGTPVSAGQGRLGPCPRHRRAKDACGPADSSGMRHRGQHCSRERTSLGADRDALPARPVWTRPPGWPSAAAPAGMGYGGARACENTWSRRADVKPFSYSSSATCAGPGGVRVASSQQQQCAQPQRVQRSSAGRSRKHSAAELPAALSRGAAETAPGRDPVGARAGAGAPCCACALWTGEHAAAGITCACQGPLAMRSLRQQPRNDLIRLVR